MSALVPRSPMKAGSSVKLGSEQDSLLELCTCQVQGQEMMWEAVTSLVVHHTCTPPPSPRNPGHIWLRLPHPGSHGGDSLPLFLHGDP